MRILIDIGHPAHVHYFRNFVRAMEERGHHCIALRKSGQAGVNVLGFKVYAEEDVDKAEAFLSMSWM